MLKTRTTACNANRRKVPLNAKAKNEDNLLKLLVVEPFRLDQSGRDKLVSTGRTFIAVDMLGAGVNDYVLISQGSSARFTPETQKLPIDCAIIGIVDSVNIEKLQVYSRSEEE